MEWGYKALNDPNISLAFSKQIFYPEGASLLYHDLSFYNLFIFSILRPFFNPIALYNLLILSTFLLSGMGAFLLIKYLTRDSLVSLIGGFIFAFNPSHFAHSQHHITVSSIQFIPFFVLFFIKALKSNSKRYLFLASLFFLMNTLTTWVNLFIAICFMVFSYVYLMWQRKKIILLDVFIKMGIIILITGLIFLPWVSKLISTDLIYPLDRGGHDIFVADAFAFFIPDPYHLLANIKIFKNINQRFSGFPWEGAVYLGIVNLSIILFTFKRTIKKTARYFWGFFAFLVMAMGTQVNVLGQRIPILLPFSLIKRIPLLLHFRVPSRNIVLVYLFLAIISAFALKYLFDLYKSSKKRNYLLILLCFLIFFDYYSICNKMTKVYLPAGYKAIKSEDDEFGILDLPKSYIAIHAYMWYQTQHGFPIVQGDICHKIRKSLIDRLEFKDLLKQKKQLQEDNVKYIVIHKKFLSPDSPYYSPYYIKDYLLIDIKEYTKQYKILYEDGENIIFQVY